MRTRVPRITPSDITPPEVYFSRRALLAGALATGASALLPAAEVPQAQGTALSYSANPQYSVKEPPNKYEEITGYNNFYEFGTDKDSPSHNAHTLRTRPWSVNVYGEAEVRGTFELEDLLKGVALEERIYRFRCVEAWSLVVPWVGFPLSALLARFKPTSRAKYVEFTTLYDPRGGAQLAVCRGAAHRRGDASPHPHGGRLVRPGAAQPGWCAAAAHRAVEIRLQGHQVDRQDRLHECSATHCLEPGGAG
jgi:DMSO/TMAO reductase YedYZ molybdopterin-dependent catalytic subunit